MRLFTYSCEEERVIHKKFSICILTLLMAIILSACNNIDKKIIDLYEEYLKELKNNNADNVQAKMLYPENMPTDYYYLDKQSIETDTMTTYEVKGINKLNQYIYEVNSVVEKSDLNEPIEFNFYVLKIKDDFKIMINSRYIPDEYKQGLTFPAPGPDDILLEDIIK